MTKQEWIEKFTSKFLAQMIAHDSKMIMQTARAGYDPDEDPEKAAMEEFENWVVQNQDVW